MYSTSEFKKGLKIEIDGDPYLMVDFQHVKPGKGVAFTRTKLKNLITQRVIERTFRSGEKVGKPDMSEGVMEYLYKEGDAYHFMNTASYEQTHINKEDLGDIVSFLKEGAQVSVLFFRGKPIGIELPTFVDLKIVSVEPGVRGDTVTGAMKPAVLETGAIVNVPLFVNQDELIRIDTRTGTYAERVK